jgi:hypothetical protein
MFAGGAGLLRFARNDGQMHLRDLATRCARVLQNTLALIRQRAQAPLKERAQGKPGARGTRGPACSVESTQVVTTGPPNTRLPLRDGFNGLCRALPGDEFVLSPSSANGWRYENPVGLAPPPPT